MLSEILIKELSDYCPSTKILVSKAWPSLSTESKLQLIFAHNRISLERVNLPIWLYELALDDSAEIVRIFATMYSGINSSCLLNVDVCEAIYGKQALGQMKILLDKIAMDKSEVVRNLSELDNYYIFSDLQNVSQESRLIIIRRMHKLHLSFFINELNKFTTELSKENLIECLDEIITNSSIESTAGGINELIQGWQFISSLDEDVSSRIARILPINEYYFDACQQKMVCHQEVSAELFLNLPPLALFWVLRKNQKMPTKQLLNLVRTIVNDTSSRFDDHVKNIALQIFFDEKLDFIDSEKPSQTGFLSRLKKLIKK
jgi:hypothetical protein